MATIMMITAINIYVKCNEKQSVTVATIKYY